MDGKFKMKMDMECVEEDVKGWQVGEVVACSSRRYQNIRQKHLNDIQCSWNVSRSTWTLQLIMEDIQQAWSCYIHLILQFTSQSQFHSTICNSIWTSSFSNVELRSRISNLVNSQNLISDQIIIFLLKTRVLKTIKDMTLAS